MENRWHQASGLRMPVLGLGKLNGLRDLINVHSRRRNIEELPIRFATLATDLDHGRAVLLDRGPTAIAVATSASMPIRYEPQSIDGKRLIDQALSAPVPVDAARSLGADFAIAVDVAYRPHEEPTAGITGGAFQMFHMMVNRLTGEQIRRADFAIRLDVQPTLRDEGGTAAVIQAGEHAVRQHWPALQAALRKQRGAAARQRRNRKEPGEPDHGSRGRFPEQEVIRSTCDRIDDRATHTAVGVLAFVQQVAQMDNHLLQVGQPLLDLRQPGVGDPAHGGTVAPVFERKQAGNPLQSEAGLPYALDEAGPRNRLRRMNAVGARAFLRCAEQFHFRVMTHGLDADIGAAREPADRQRRSAPGRDICTHDFRHF